MAALCCYPLLIFLGLERLVLTYKLLFKKNHKDVQLMSNVLTVDGQLSILDQSQIEPYLDVTKGEYTAYIMPVKPANLAIAQAVRSVHIRHLHNAGYRGYDEVIDDTCHRSGIYFFVCKDSRVVLLARVNFRSTQVFPFEMGVTDAGKQYSYLPAEHAADINTYSVEMRHIRRSSPLLLACLGRFLRAEQVTRLFCLVDQNNSVTRRMYDMAGFRYSLEFNQPIHFESFVNSADDQPTRWKILEMAEAEISGLGERTLR